MDKDKLEDLLTEGLQVDDYILSKSLGSGTFGFVWKAEKEGTSYVLKFLKEKYDSDTLQKEYQLMLQLDHPNIVHEYGIFQWESFTYMVLEFIPGNPMDKFVSKKSKKMEFIY